MSNYQLNKSRARLSIAENTVDPGIYYSYIVAISYANQIDCLLVMFNRKSYSVTDAPSKSAMKLVFEIMIIKTMRFCDKINLENDFSSSNMIIKLLNTRNMDNVI